MTHLADPFPVRFVFVSPHLRHRPRHPLHECPRDLTREDRRRDWIVACLGEAAGDICMDYEYHYLETERSHSPPSRGAEKTVGSKVARGG